MGPPAPQTALVPIYTALTERWRAAGKVVPGVYDREWVELMSRPAWPEDGALPTL